MRFPIQTISRKFVALTLVLVSLLLLPFSAYFNSKFREASEKAGWELVAAQEAATLRAADLLMQFVARISSEAIMAKDIYALKVYATEVLRDSSVMSIEILGMDGKALLNMENPLFKQGVNVPDSLKKQFKLAVVTDKERLGIEQQVGEVLLTVSYLNL